MGERRREAPRAPGSAVPSPGDLDALEVAVRRYSEKAGLAGIGSGPLRLVLVNQVHRVLATASCPHTTSRLVGQIAAEDALANLGQAGKLTRSYAVLLEALGRHRGKGQPQVVRVERVTVEAGGQAIVGAVGQGGGGSGTGSDGRPHAKALAHAPEPTLRGQDPGREPVPVAGGEGEEAL